jgi:hypothetical protein
MDDFRKKNPFPFKCAEEVNVFKSIGKYGLCNGAIVAEF